MGNSWTWTSGDTFILGDNQRRFIAVVILIVLANHDAHAAALLLLVLASYERDFIINTNLVKAHKVLDKEKASIGQHLFEAPTE